MWRALLFRPLQRRRPDAEGPLADGRPEKLPAGPPRPVTMLDWVAIALTDEDRPAQAGDGSGRSRGTAPDGPSSPPEAAA